MKSFDISAAQASVSHLKRLSQSNNGKVPSEILRATATRLNCGERTLWRWLKNGLPASEQSRVLGGEQLIAVASAQGNLKRAWTDLQGRGLYTPGYRQFVRDFGALPPMMRNGLRYGVARAIDNGLFLKSNPEARLDRVIFDHTEADIRLQRLSGGKLEMFRPWISLMIDSGTRFILATVITEGDGLKGDPNTESLVALMATAIRGQHSTDGTFIGGIPKLVQCDNAKAHLAEAMLSGFLHLGITGSLIDPGSPWQDGKVERLMRTFKDEFLATLPGFTAALPTRYNKESWKPEGCLTVAEFKERLIGWVDTYNFERIHSSLNATPFEAWKSDTTVIEQADDGLIRHAFLASSKPRRVSKNGVRFEDIDYTDPALANIVGKKVTLRYLPNDRTFVDVMVDGQFVCTATAHSHLSIEARRVIVRNRIASSKKVDHIIKESTARASRKTLEGNPLLSQERNPLATARPAPSTDEDDFLAFMDQVATNEIEMEMEMES